MNEIDRWLTELRRDLRVGGAARRRIVAECAEHLRESAARHGETEAVARFGRPAEIAEGFNVELGAHRSRWATVFAAIALVAAAAATIHLAHEGPQHLEAPWPVALVFFVAAQVAAVALGSAVAQAVRWRTRTASPGELVLQSRRTAVAVVAGALTLGAAAVSVTGGSDVGWVVAGGFVLLAGAGWAALRARRLLGAATPSPVTPLDDAAALLASVPLAGALAARVRDLLDPVRHPLRCCALVAALAASAAFARNQGERGATAGQSLALAAIEAGAVVACFVVLGPPLGLRASRG